MKQQLCTCITLFCTDFFADLARTTTQNFLISRFVENVTTRQEVTACFFFLSFFLFFSSYLRLDTHIVWTGPRGNLC